MQVTYHISIQTRTLADAVKRFGLNGNIVGQPVIIPTGGVGTELKNLIAKFGLKPGLNCKCGQHIREMDTKGVEWCEQNIAVIIEWLREEAQRAKLPFTAIGAKVLIRRAIKNAKKKKDQDMITVKLIVDIDTDSVYEALERTKPKEGKVTAVSVEPQRIIPGAPAVPTPPGAIGPVLNMNAQPAIVRK